MHPRQRERENTHLGHGLEEAAREALLLGLDDAGDEYGAGCKDKVGAKDGEDGGGEAVGPVGGGGCVGGDDGEEDGGAGGDECAGC